MNRVHRSILYSTLILSFLIVNLIDASGQTEIDSVKYQDNRESYSDKLNVYVYGIQKSSNFELKKEGIKDKLEYSPNENLNLGLGFSYKWIGIGAAFNLGFVNSDNDLYGETKSFDLQMDIYSRKFLLSGNLQHYQGYAWRNPDDYMTNWSTQDSLIVRPDITTATIGFSGTYIFNHENFSFKAAYQNTERQLKSAGSWLLGLRLSVYAIDNDSSLIPLTLQEDFNSTPEFGSLGAVNLGVAFGYTYTAIFKKYFYFNGALMIGINLQSIATYDLLDEPIGTEGTLSSNALLKIALGCNKPTHFYGINISVDSFLVKSKMKTEFSYDYGKVRFFYGRRFTIGNNQTN